jgi:hypothetical protein
MTKKEFFALRDKQRADGKLKKIVSIKHPENKLSLEEEQRILTVLRKQAKGIYKTESLGLKNLLTTVEYTGSIVKVVRKKIDELDNITVWRIN